MTAKRSGCPRRTCHAPDTGCILGFEPSNCQHFAHVASESSELQADGPRIPWSGLALGRDDLPPIAALGRVRLVALVGLQNAGKTTALAAAMIARRRGSTACGAFAGSYTLLGWQQIARHLEWPPQGIGGFPPHTSSAEQRVPSLLHMALSNDGQITNVLYTDVPGEWFRRWAMDEDAMEATTWLASHASSFVIFADSEALAGNERGRALGEYEALARRLATNAQGRPVVPIRAKSDQDVRSSILERLDGLNNELFGSVSVAVSISAADGDAITEPIDRGTAAALSPTCTTIDSSPSGPDPLLAYCSDAAAAR